jgi:hypothetical protein
VTNPILTWKKEAKALYSVVLGARRGSIKLRLTASEVRYGIAIPNVRQNSVICVNYWFVHGVDLRGFAPTYGQNSVQQLVDKKDSPDTRSARCGG